MPAVQTCPASLHCSWLFMTTVVDWVCKGCNSQDMFWALYCAVLLHQCCIRSLYHRPIYMLMPEIAKADHQVSYNIRFAWLNSKLFFDLHCAPSVHLCLQPTSNNVGRQAMWPGELTKNARCCVRNYSITSLGILLSASVLRNLC